MDLINSVKNYDDQIKLMNSLNKASSPKLQERKIEDKGIKLHVKIFNLIISFY